ncbi:MAG: low temperature requirement protein A, partial [Acidimicrobiia bacterium]
MTLARWTPPRLASQRSPDQRTVLWLELFYDLVFVAALIQLGQTLISDLTWRGAGRFVVLFALLWWAWTGTTFLMNRVDVDDIIHRSLMIAQMFAIGTVAVLVDGAFGVHSAGFALAYFFVRLTLVLMYARVWWHIPKARQLAQSFLVVNGIAAAMWLVSVFVPTPGRYWLWGLAFLIDVSWIVLPGSRRRAAREFPADEEHMGERYALFTIIVLGESFIKIIGAVADHGVTADTLVHMALAFVIAAGLWWTYFDDIADSPIKSWSPAVPIAAVWTVLHLPLTMGLTAVGVGLELLALTDMGDRMDSSAAWLLIGALVLVLVAVAGLDGITDNRHFGVTEQARLFPRFGAMVLLVLLGLASSELSSTVFGLAVTAVVIGQIAIEVVVAKRADHTVRVHVEEVMQSAVVEDRCEHLARNPDIVPNTAACRQCINNGLVWVHLRVCTVCGQVGCCDDSPARHASEHFLETGHPTIRSMEAGEDWAWCYVDKVAFRSANEAP